MGERSGFQNTSGSQNVFIGYLSGMKGTSTWGNVCIGYQSGQELTLAYSNVFVGESTGRLTTWGEGNVFLGNQAGESNVTGSWNVHIGTGAGQKANASDNIFVGYGSGYNTTTGVTNVFIGNQTGTSNTTGKDNVYIGNGTGYGNIVGSGNVFIGKNAGWSETGSNKLYIDNSNTTTPLIYGDFSSNYLRLNGNVGISAIPAYKLDIAGNLNISKGISSQPALYVNGDEALWSDGSCFSWGFGSVYNYFARKVTIGTSVNPSVMLYVQGTVSATAYVTNSDKRYKTNFKDVENVIPAIKNIRPVFYDWNADLYPEMKFDKARQIGFIAQDIEPLFPEMVQTDNNGYKSVDYGKMTVVLLEAVKEQQKQIESSQEENNQLKSQLQALQEKVEQIETLLAKNGEK